MDIRAGDLVVCVDGRLHPASHKMELVEGRHYRVRFVDPVSRPHPVFGMDDGELRLQGVAPDVRSGFAACRFRKLNDEADDLALIEMIKGRRPVETAEPTREPAQVRP
jgi:hypothetical protein